MNMAIIGISGKMGQLIYESYKDEFNIIGVDLINHPEVKTYDNIDEIINDVNIVVDFSSYECFDFLKTALKKHKKVLSGTTGYSFEQIAELKLLAKNNQTNFIWQANYARGINLFSDLAKECMNKFDKLDLVEIHSTTKKDKPSGTAKVLAKSLGISEENIQSVRVNNAPTIHEIIFSSFDERLIIRHEVLNKKAFLKGFDDILRKIIRS